MRPAQRGMGAVLAIIVLVVMAAFAAAIVRVSAVAQASNAQNLLSARAWQAARAGTEWGLYLAFKGNWSGCSQASQELDLRAATGFHVSVSCDSRSFNEGETAAGVPRVVHVYTIDAVACNGSSSCPDQLAAIKPNYIERHRQVHASD